MPAQLHWCQWITAPDRAYYAVAHRPAGIVGATAGYLRIRRQMQQLGHRPRESTGSRIGSHHLRQEARIEIEGGQHLAGPVRSLDVEEAGSGGIRYLQGPDTGQAVADIVLGQRHGTGARKDLRLVIAYPQ